MIGFIGQGWIGKNYADDFEERGHEVVRYGLEPEYAGNKERIAECDIVFIAVPTPTRNGAEFDDSILRAVLPLVGPGKTAVVKSTMVPGTTDALQEAFPDRFVIHSPEFLTKKNAAHDARNPSRNIMGVTEASQGKAEEVLGVLPKAPYVATMPAKTAELIKYAANGFLTMKVIFANLLFDVAQSMDVDYEEVKNAVLADPRIGSTHMDVDDDGRGAGGLCFIKDFAAFRAFVESTKTPEAAEALRTLEAYNLQVLKDAGKSLDVIKDVYEGA